MKLLSPNHTVQKEIVGTLTKSVSPAVKSANILRQCPPRFCAFGICRSREPPGNYESKRNCPTSGIIREHEQKQQATIIALSITPQQRCGECSDAIQWILDEPFQIKSGRDDQEFPFAQQKAVQVGCVNFKIFWNSPCDPRDKYTQDTFILKTGKRAGAIAGLPS